MIWIAIITLFAALAFWFLNRGSVETPGEISDDMELSDFVRENDDWVVLDTETTRLGPKAEVLEISIVDKAGKVLLDTLVNPKGSISAESKAVHGIDRKMVADAPTWPQIAAKFEDIVSDRAVFAYNAKFDFGVIEQTYDRWNLHPAAVQNVQGLCAMLAYADHRGGTKWHKLKDACDHEGVNFPEQHRALADAEATRRLILAMAKGGEAVQSKKDEVPEKQVITVHQNKKAELVFSSGMVPDTDAGEVKAWIEDTDELELSIDYVDGADKKSRRAIRARNFYKNKRGEVVIRAWCLNRGAVRHFKMDRIASARDVDGDITNAEILSRLTEE